MRHTFRALFLLPALVLAACGDDTPDEQLAAPASVSTGQEFHLRYGDTIRAGDLLLNFSAVLEESRCPIDAICIWEGNARIAVTASRDSVTGILELNTTPPFATSAVFEGHVIELRELQPYPGAITTLPRPQAYSATLFVDRVAVPAAN